MRETLTRGLEDSIIKVSILPKLNFMFIEIPMKLSSRVFVDIDKFIMKILWRSTNTRLSKTFFSKRNKVESTTLLVLALTI